MLSIIMHYAQRNELMHTNFVPLIRVGKFKDLSTILHNDLCYLRLVVPPGDFAESDLMQSLLESIIDIWFVRPEEDPHKENDGLWVPSQRLWEYWKELQNSTTSVEGVAKLNKKMSDDIIKHLMKLRRQLEEDRMVKDMVKLNSRSCSKI